MHWAWRLQSPPTSGLPLKDPPTDVPRTAADKITPTFHPAAFPSGEAHATERPLHKLISHARDPQLGHDDLGCPQAPASPMRVAGPSWSPAGRRRAGIRTQANDMAVVHNAYRHD